MQLIPTTEEAEDPLIKLLKNLEVTKAAGVDEISKISKSLKDGMRILVKPVSDLCNLSMALISFPDVCKIAKLQPLFKKDSKTDPPN